MNSDYKRSLEDWLKWYNYQHSTLRNSSLENKVIFLDKCVRGLFELVALTADEVERNHQNRNVPQIVLPTGLRLLDPLRETES